MGNGAAMRVAPLGAFFAADLDRTAEQAALSADPTHAHPDGKAGAIAIAVAAACATRTASGLFDAVLAQTPAGATRDGIAQAAKLDANTDVQDAVKCLGNGSKVISSDTVPFALWCAARHLGNYEEAMWTAVSALGDIDTNCAIVGGIVALSGGAIPSEWLARREALP